MASAIEWYTTSQENLLAANEAAGKRRWRCACSRAYYAAHHSAHAVLVHFEPPLARQPRSISHGELPARLFRTLRRHGAASELVADLVRIRLGGAYTIRIESDYKPQFEVGREKYSMCLAAARQAFDLARSLLK